MSEDTPKKQPETFAEAHEMYLENITSNAEKVMNDERLNFFRTRVRRRVLAAIMFLSGLSVFVSMSMSFDTSWSYPSYIAIGLYVLLLTFGNRVARGFMGLPKKLVDERILQRRMESYVYAFHLILTLLVLLIPVLLFSGVKTYNFAENIDDPIGGILGFIFVVSTLPMAVFLWREPEL